MYLIALKFWLFQNNYFERILFWNFFTETPPIHTVFGGFWLPQRIWGGGSDLTLHLKSLFSSQNRLLGPNYSKLISSNFCFHDNVVKITFWTTFCFLKVPFSKVVGSAPPLSPYIRQYMYKVSRLSVQKGSKNDFFGIMRWIKFAGF